MGIAGDGVTIVVDVANVMGSRPDGWWRDRAGAALRLHEELARLAASGRTVSPDGDVAGRPGVVMVLEGAAKAAAARIGARSEGPDRGNLSEGPDRGKLSEGPDRGKLESAAEVRPGEVRVVQAPGSGDDAIVAVVRGLGGHCYVATADRELRSRCAAEGAKIIGPGWLLGLLHG